MNPPLQELSPVINCINAFDQLIQTLLQCRSSDFKSEYMFRTCSVAANLMSSLTKSFQLLCYITLRFLANYGTIPCSHISLIQKHCYVQCYKRIRNVPEQRS